MAKTKTFKILLLAIFMIFPFNPAHSYEPVHFSTEESINISVYNDVTPSVVSIEAEVDEGLSTGTGCIISKNGLILTSMHVVNGAKSIEITTHSKKVYNAKLLAILKNNNDLALIKIEPKEDLKTAKMGNSDMLKVGQRVLTVGNPFGFSGTLTTGIVSRIDYARNKIQTDAAINPGCSGGPLLNIQGEVIGINQSIYNPDNNRSNIGIGFAVPINNAKEFIAVAINKLAQN